MKIYKCPHCGNTAVLLDEKGPKLHCCGEEMQLLEAGVTDGAVEKHVPFVKRKEGGKVKIRVGEVDHPMTTEHHISWILLETQLGFQFAKLSADGKPKAKFKMRKKDTPIAAYEYCNLHGLWKRDIDDSIVIEPKEDKEKKAD